MKIVPANQFSIEELANIYNQTRADYLVSMQMTADRLQRYLVQYDVDTAASVVAIDDSRPVGLCMLGLRASRAWVTRLGVVPVARRAGWAAAMLQACLAQAGDRDVQRVQLEVIMDNEPAHRLFEQFGFRDVRRLLVLRRPAGMPLASPPPDITTETWLEGNAVLAAASNRPWRPAWTNESASLARASELRALRLREAQSGRCGWVCFSRSAARLEQVIVGAATGSTAPAYALLYHLHSQYPAYEAIAENIPARSPHLDSFYAHGYVNSFARIEMVLEL